MHSKLPLCIRRMIVKRHQAKRRVLIERMRNEALDSGRILDHLRRKHLAQRGITPPLVLIRGDSL